MSKIRNILKKILKLVRGCQKSKLLSKLAKARKIHFLVNQGVLKLIDVFFPVKYEKKIDHFSQIWV